MTRDNHVFGPVPSRRLGISLGIDLVPYKHCTLNCLYCECGPTTNLTVSRESHIESEVIIDQLKEILSHSPKIDYITFSGSGEPTLYKELGVLVNRIKGITATPIALLTNSTLLTDRDIRNQVKEIDVVLPSLDAVSKETFNRLNQPHPSLDINKIIDGLIQFRDEYSGRIWLEVFVIKGINDHEEELDLLYHTIKKIRPDRVQLNSLDRPAAFQGIEPVSIGDLEKICERWKDLPVEIIKRVQGRNEILSFSKNLENNILNTIQRRPLTIEDLIELTGYNRLALYKYIDILEREKKIKPKIVGDRIFYTPTSQSL